MNATIDSRDPESDREHYRAVSGWAVGALLLGLASIAALNGPVLWVVPLAGIVVALIAMRRISGSPGELIGRNVALLGLLLALLFGVAAVAHTYTRQYWIERRGELFAREFIGLLADRNGHAAHQLTVAPGLRKPLGDNPAEAYAKDPESTQRYSAFCEREPIHTLLGSEDRSPAEIESVRFAGSEEIGDFVNVLIRIPGTVDAAASRRAKLVLLRTASATHAERWQVVSADME